MSCSQAALDNSLPIKRIEAGLKTLALWGRIMTQNGKVILSTCDANPLSHNLNPQDYLIAEGGNEPQLTLVGQVHADRKYFYSQDGAKWVDLQAIDSATSERAASISTILISDVAKQYEVADPNAPPPAEGEEASKGFVIPELAVLRQRVDAVNSACGIEPVGSTIINGQNKVVPNRLFAGLSYPEKLESYAHRPEASGVTRDLSKTLGDDLRGTWSVHYDPFKQQAVVRSLLFLGYTMYYSGADNAWGALYQGYGLRNSDLIFML